MDREQLSLEVITNLKKELELKDALLNLFSIGTFVVLIIATIAITVMAIKVSSIEKETRDPCRCGLPECICEKKISTKYKR